MFRVVKLSGKFYATELPEDPEEAMAEIENFSDDGTPVIIVTDIGDLDYLDIDSESVKMVDRSDDD